MPGRSVSSVTPATLAPSVGERNPAARLTTKQVRAIRAAHAAGGRVTHLAAAFRVSPRTVRHVVRGTTWAHLERWGMTTVPTMLVEAEDDGTYSLRGLSLEDLCLLAALADFPLWEAQPKKINDFCSDLVDAIATGLPAGAPTIPTADAVGFVDAVTVGD